MKIDKDMEPSLKSFDRFTLRIPKDLKEEATRRADSLNTSLNELVTSTLQRAISGAAFKPSALISPEMLEGKILEYLEIVELGTKSMSDGLNLNEKILLTSAKKWNNMIDNIESVNRNLAKISSLPAEIKEQKRESREEIEWFKKSLSEESRRYKKELLVSSLKIQAGAALVSILSLGGLFLVFSYLI
jgi:hypothetical protein